MFPRVGAYFHRCLIALDVGVNVLFGGISDETISSRVRRASDAHLPLSLSVWVAHVLNHGLNRIQSDHGRLAEEGDLARAKADEQIEDTALDILVTAAKQGALIPVAAVIPAVAAIVSNLSTSEATNEHHNPITASQPSPVAPPFSGPDADARS